jgi:hypothetical protein
MPRGELRALRPHDEDREVPVPQLALFGDVPAVAAPVRTEPSVDGDGSRRSNGHTASLTLGEAARIMREGNPVVPIRSPRLRDVERELFSADDVVRIVAAQPELRDRVALKLLFLMLGGPAQAALGPGASSLVAPLPQPCRRRGRGGNAREKDARRPLHVRD